MEGSWQWEQREHCHKFLLGLLTHAATQTVSKQAANEGISCGRVDRSRRPLEQKQHQPQQQKQKQKQKKESTAARTWLGRLGITALARGSSSGAAVMGPTARRLVVCH